ncbi:cytochrome C assembly protein, partial [Staphylococcus aureus]
MQENLFIRFNEIILLIYLISIICYFYDFVQKSHKIRSLGIYLLGIVWVLQTISLSIFIIQTRHIPLGLILNLIKVLNFSVFFLNLIGLTLL